MQRSRVPLLPVITIAFCSATMIVVLFGIWQMRSGTLPPHELDALRLVHRQILDDYIAERDAKELVYEAIDGMVRSLDRYSRFVPPDEVRAFEGDEIRGTYEGIGVVPVPSRSPFTVAWPFPDGPAARAGVRVGDEILTVDDVEIDSYSKAFDLLLGPAGSTAMLGISRADIGATDTRQQVAIEVERGAVRKPSVKWAQSFERPDVGRVGYLYVAEFQQDMVEAFDHALLELESTGEPLAGLVIDLRSNPGGLLTQAIDLANRFVAKGTIVSLKNRAGEVLDRHDARAELCNQPTIPLAILVDRNSASAAEVFAGAMQDYGRAEIVGERTFGKGVVQQIYSWPHHDFRLKMTSSHYYTPSGRSLARELRREDRDGQEPGGVDPDVHVAMTVDDVRGVRESLQRHEPPSEFSGDVDALLDQLGLDMRTMPPSPASDAVLAAALGVFEPGVAPSEK